MSDRLSDRRYRPTNFDHDLAEDVRHQRPPFHSLPSVEEMASRYGRPQPQIPDYVTPTHYLVYDVECGTVLIPREWYDGREAEIEAAR